MKKKRIYTQGRFDGACFLYSMANCYTALTGKVLSQESWDKVVVNVPKLHDFLCGTKGTQNYDTLLFINALDNTLNCISRKHSFGINKISINELYQNINKDSVVIAAVKGDTERQEELDHWVCCVGAEGGSILIACSWADYGCNNEYEKKDVETDRWYNDKITKISALNKHRIYAISKKHS